METEHKKMLELATLVDKQIEAVREENGSSQGIHWDSHCDGHWNSYWTCSAPALIQAWIPCPPKRDDVEAWSLLVLSFINRHSLRDFAENVGGIGVYLSL